MAKGYLYDNGYELISREEALPDTSEASEGDILSLNSEKEPKWTTPESGLPDTTSASAGDVLSLDEDKDPVWSAPSGGGGAGVLIDATGEFNNVSFNEETYSGTPISGTLADYIDAIESGKQLIIVTEGGAGTLNYSYPVRVTPAEAYNVITMLVSGPGGNSEACIGYPTDHPNDLYYLIPTQV